MFKKVNGVKYFGMEGVVYYVRETVLTTQVDVHSFFTSHLNSYEQFSKKLT